MHSVLFVCTGNSARSQLGEALMRAHCGSSVRVASAGTNIARQINPFVPIVLEEMGIKSEGLYPKTFRDVESDQWETVITVCTHANDNCPAALFKGREHIHWDLDDPTTLDSFRETAAWINESIKTLTASWKDIDIWEKDRDEEGKVVFNFSITDSTGKDLFEVRCSKCDTVIDEGISRYKCMDCGLARCSDCGTECETQKNHITVLEDSHPVWLHISVRGDTPSSTLCNAFRIYSERPCLGQLIDGVYHWLSYDEVFKKAKSIAYSINQIRKTNERMSIGVYSRNSVPWILCDFACTLNGDAVAGLLPHFNQNDIEMVMNHMDMVIVSSEFTDRLDHERYTVVLMDDLLDGVDQVVVSPPPLPDTLFTYLITSGSSGIPKLAMISGSTWVKDVDQPVYIEPYIDYSWLPMGHGTGRISVWTALMNGGRVGLASQNMMKDLTILKPSVLLAPPLFWDTLYKQYCTMLDSGENEDDTVQRINEIVGGRLAYCGVGMAPVGSAVLSFMKRCFKQVQEGYGSTEVGGITVNNVISPHADIKLFDVDGYTYPRGEICVKTNTAFMGYEGISNDDMYVDGYFKTGDIGEIMPGNRLVIIDRLSSVSKLSTGEWFSPSRLESVVLEQCPTVRQVFIDLIDDVIFIVTVSDSDAKVLSQEIRSAFTALQVPVHEWPTKLYIETVMWSEGNGLTATGKLVRRHLRDKYSVCDGVTLHSSVESTNTLEMVLSMARSVTGVTEINPQHRFIDAGGDSISGLRFVMMLGQKWPFASRMDPTLIISTSFKLLGVLIDQRCPRRLIDEFNCAHRDDLASMMDKDGVYVGVDHPIEPHGNGILITGATGFVGKHVLQHLITRTKRPIYSLVRGSAPEYDGVINIVGSLTDMTNLEIIRERISTVVHIAAQVDFYQTYDILRVPNVEGTRHLLDLCDSSMAFHYVSTLSVLHDSTLEVPLPQAADDRIIGAGGYTQSKWVAEHVVANSNVPYSVLRLGMITWSSKTGEFNEIDWLMRLLRDACTRGVYPLISGIVKYTPVDHAALDIVNVVMGQHRGVHHVLTKAIPISSIYAALSEYRKLMGIGCLTGIQWGIWREEAKNVDLVSTVVDMLDNSDLITPCTEITEIDDDFIRYISYLRL